MIFSKVVSTKYAKELKARARTFRDKRVAARIRVPMEMRWWYWLEFGTALRGENPEHKSKYDIYPRNKSALAWPKDAWPGARMQPQGKDDKFVFQHVSHPGIHPQRIVRSVLRDVRRTMGAKIADAILEWSITDVRKALMNEVMPEAKNKIVRKMRQKTRSTPRSDEYAKLPGTTAAAAFDAGAFIEDSSEGREYDSGYREGWMKGPQKTVPRKPKNNKNSEISDREREAIKRLRQNPGMKHGDDSWVVGRAWERWKKKTGWGKK